MRRLLSAGYEAYIVGGAVRDSLLGKTPKDYDITTIATPEQVRHVFGRRKCRIIGRRFRLALVFEGGEIFEVSTFRREPTMKERHTRQDDEGAMIWNDNVYGTFEDDVKRRDFTVNALYYDVNRQKIVDRVGGINDLNCRIVRCIGEPDTRFVEDPVRMLRALKLVGQNSFALSKNIQQSILAHAQLIQSASPARLTEEFMKIMNCDSALGIVEACEKYGFLKFFMPELSRIWDTEGGELIRSMLKQHDECLEEDDDFLSQRSFAFAIISLPYLLGCMDIEDIVVHRHWAEARQQCKASIRKFFECFDVIREVELDLCDLAIMMPTMMYARKLPFALRDSPLYPFAYELFRMLTMATGNLTDRFRKLPFPTEAAANREEDAWNDGVGEAESAADDAEIAASDAHPENPVAVENSDAERNARPSGRRRAKSRQQNGSAVKGVKSKTESASVAENASDDAPPKPARRKRRKKKSSEKKTDEEI